MKAVLITGANGFPGRAVVEALAEDGYTIRAASRQAPPGPLSQGVTAVQYNPDTPNAWPPLLDGIDTVIHLDTVKPRLRRRRDALYDRLNRQVTEELAEAARGVGHFVFISSIAAQCGHCADHAVTESDPAAPTGAYGRSMLAAEGAVSAAGIPFTILRLAPLYGPGMEGDLSLIRRAAASFWPLPTKELINRRSFLSLDNFIAALKFVLATPAARANTYLVADPGIPPATWDVLATLRRAQGRRPLITAAPVQYVEVALRFLRRPDLWDRLAGNLRVDSRKLLNAGWRPLHDTRAGLTLMAQPPAATLPHAGRRSASA
jgi:UDP-glucose 4-epimerase